MKTPWSPRYYGYRANLDGDQFCILVTTMEVLRRCHGRLFPGRRFNPKLCHPANIRRTK